MNGRIPTPKIVSLSCKLLSNIVHTAWDWRKAYGMANGDMMFFGLWIFLGGDYLKYYLHIRN